MTPVTKEQFDAFLAAHPEEKAPAFLTDYNAETDGEVTYNVDGNGDLLVECATSGRFAKYPWPKEGASV
jgi:hypothetical protein